MLKTAALLELLADRAIPAEGFDAGEKIFLEDDRGDCLYVVRSGLINIVTFGRALENVGPGGIFGEIALVDDGPRSASAMAAVDTEVFSVDRDAFLKLVRAEPAFALDVMRTLATRVRRATEQA